MMKLILLPIVISLLIAGCDSERAASKMPHGVELGSPAPDFTLRDLREKNTSLSDYKGKVVLLIFWKVKCNDCLKTLASVETLKEQFKDQDFAAISVNVDNLEYVKPQKIHDFLKDNKYTFKVLVDETFSTSEAYNIIAVPMTYLIDRKGIISYMKFGEEDWTRPDNIEGIQKLLKG